jgi:hypothetical protein
MDDLAEYLRSILPKGAHKHVDDIVEYVTTMPLYAAVETAEVNYARVPVETVRAYGLELRLDASGNAVTVTFPHGAEVIE